MSQSNGKTRARAPRIMLYSHDTFGLGHYRRNRRLATALASAELSPEILLVTGSPRARSFPEIPHTELYELPEIVKQSDGSYSSGDTQLPIAEMIRLRSELILAAADGFQPDLVLVDHAPVGALGELRPLLRRFGPRPDCILVVGLRDIIDDVAQLETEWERYGARRAVENVFDHVLVYGPNGFPTTVKELGLDKKLNGQMEHTGFLLPPMPQPDEAAARGGPVLVTTGGGGDGAGVLEAWCRFLEDPLSENLQESVVVTGPYLAEEERERIERRIRQTGHSVQLLKFSRDMPRLIASASAIITMGGYNTVTEILSARKPALIIPRETPRREQIIRAQRMESHFGMEWASIAHASPARIAAFLNRANQGCVPVLKDRDGRGLDHVVGFVSGLIGTGSTGTVTTSEVAGS